MAADLFASRMSDAFTNLSLLDEDSGRMKAGTRPVDIPSAAEQNAHFCMCTVPLTACDTPFVALIFHTPFPLAASKYSSIPSVQSIWSGASGSPWASDFAPSFLPSTKAGSAAIKHVSTATSSTQWPSSDRAFLYVMFSSRGCQFTHRVLCRCSLDDAMPHHTRRINVSFFLTGRLPRFT